ncbi:hypothetical protein ASPACDRAFT_1880550 [Aspergillus aculeatus ATCC 16872]|uniref:BZIP domain-containing protein n=1 Tax=Aspergillus aculeatus (strain ATCC 16872 / CBS 172.66 / WB 5094) TaxID=690307 RepID=A0A1L9WV11_ASPA1|nr:uncharacterized protein ASPACDRAFT_1880550 [Aspergillus aculeatus ATCC 16872]OJK00077.1 hypothetical protein ASPACDRAFT_1880550 [Aspergillus aculeatus ATCC 16872]
MMSDNATTVTLAQMPQQNHLWVPEDDWTGVVDRRRRRRLQNRLNQRAYRMKQKAINQFSASEGATTESTFNVLVQARNITTHSTDSPRSHSPDEPDDNDLDCHLVPQGALQFRRQFEAIAQQSFRLGSPQIEHLVSLRRLNVHRAINENIRALGMTPAWVQPDDALSIFNLSVPGSSEAQIPPSLQPTPIQRLVPHHPWLDFFPFPRMRDVMILAGDRLDEDELCRDLMAFWDTHNTGASLVVWGTPWDPRNWEATEEFVRKWRWLLVGSPELLVSTNWWRAKRGVPALRWHQLGLQWPSSHLAN